MACEDIDVHYNEDQTEIIEMSETKIKYFNRTYKKISSKMYDYNCDVKLIVGTETFKAHRDVLEQASDYFSAMFTHNMVEKDNSVVELKEISPAGFSSMIEYFYHGYVVIDTGNIEGMIEAARFFHIDWLIGVCSHYLVCYLSLEDFALVLQLADEFVLGDVRRKVFAYMTDCFVQLAARPRSVRISFDVVHELIAEDRYLEAPEGVVLRWVLRWLAHDRTQRDQYRDELISHIRFPLLTMEELDGLPEDVLSMGTLRERIEEAREYRAVPSRQCLLDNERTCARGSRDFLVVYSGVEDDNMMHYKANGVGFLIEPMQTDILEIVFEFSAVATLGNFLFVAGGYRRSSWCSSNLVYRYDARNGAWTQITSMTHSRVSHSLVAAETVGIYAVAGIDHVVLDGMDRELILDAVELYDPRENAWKDVRALPFGCYNVGAVMAGGCVFVTGGISDDSEHSVPVDFVNRYDPAVNEWTAEASMIVGRHSHAIASVDKKLYVCGGYIANENDTMGFVDCRQNEMFSLETRQWSLLTQTAEIYGHIYGSAVEFNGTVYVLGGHRKEEICLHQIEVEEEGAVVGEGELIGPYVHKMVRLRVAMPGQYLEELRSVNEVDKKA